MQMATGLRNVSLWIPSGYYTVSVTFAMWIPGYLIPGCTVVGITPSWVLIDPRGLPCSHICTTLNCRRTADRWNT
jgi:hypothetical protein